VHASEQERADVQSSRRAWSEAQPGMAIEKLVFIDETWISTSMARRYGRAPRGQRCIAAAPHGHWHTSTFVAGLRHQQVTAPLVADGPMDGELFLAYVCQFLCPTLRAGDVVILDNLSSHKVSGVQQAIAAAGATLLYLPPYSPDLNPIEKLFAKLKGLLRKAAKRSLEALWKEIGKLLDRLSSTECTNYFTSSGYVCT
jgi:transposase